MNLKTKLIILPIVILLLALAAKIDIVSADFFWLNVKIFIISFFLNLIYELAHSWLYDWNRAPLKAEFKFYIKTILNSTIGDAFFIVAHIWVLLIFHLGVSWLARPGILDYIIIAVLGLLTAWVMEKHAKKTARWHYAKKMITVLKVGITPLIQLLITGILSVLILRLWQ